MSSQFIYFSQLIIVLRLILDKYAYSGKLKYIFICYFEGAIIRGGATIRTNTVSEIELSHAQPPSQDRIEMLKQYG